MALEPTPIAAPKLGVRPDLDPEEVDDSSLADAENMIQRDGDFRVRPGFAQFGASVNQRPLGYIDYEHFDGATKVVKGTNLGWWNLVSGAWVNITDPLNPLTGIASNPVIFRTFSKSGATWLLGTNGQDVAKKWDGTTATYFNVGGSPPIARCIAVCANRVILGNLLSGPTISPVAIDVSNFNDFDSGWGTQLVALLADTDGPIVSMLEMGTLNVAVLKSDAIFMLIAQTTGTAPFRIQWMRNLKPSGPAATRLATTLSDGSIAMIGKDGLLSIFDGASVTPFPYAIQKQIISTCNPAQLVRGHCAYDSDRRELWIFYPLTGSTDPNGGVMVNMVTQQVYPFRFPTFLATAAAKMNVATPITIGEINVPIGSITSTIGDFALGNGARRMIIGEIGGQSYQDTGASDDGTAIPFFWESPVRGNIEHLSTITHIRHRFKPTPMSQDVSVRLGARNEGGDINYGDPQSFDIAGNAVKKITPFRSTAEYFSLRYEGDATQPITFQGAAIYAKQRGRSR